MPHPSLPPFAELAHRADAGAELLALAVASDLWDDVDVAGAQRGLDRFAEHLLDVAAGDPLLVPGLLPSLPCATVGTGPRSLRLDRAVAGCPSHPLALCLVAIGIAGRVAVPLGVLSDGRSFYVARSAVRRPTALDPLTGFRPTTVRDPDQIRWRCPHEIAHALLGHLADEAVRCGDLGRAVGAMELRAEMVSSDADREVALAQRDGMRARLN